MSLPHTPKKADEGISDIIRDLSARWGLQIPPRNEPYSPSRDSRPERVEDQVHFGIKWLYYRNRDALDYAITQFEKYAVGIFSQWQFKLRGDLDVLPVRSADDSALRRDSFLKRSEITGDAAADLTKSLLRFLTDVMARVRSNVDYRDSNTPQEAMPPKKIDTSPQRPKSARPFRRQTSISQFFSPKKDDLPVKAALPASSHPSSDEFALDRETSIALEDIVMKDVPTMSPPVTPSKIYANPFGMTIPPPDSADEEYQTPPTSPLLNKSRDIRSRSSVPLQSFEDPKNEIYYLQQYDPVRLPEPSLSGRKRSFDPSRPLGPRKVSRDGNADKISTHHNVNYMSPVIIPTSNEIGNQRSLNPVVDNQMPLLPKQDLNRSFDSITSAATSMTAASKAWRSPNISFTTDSPMTSFSSSADTSDLTEASTIKYPVLVNDRHRAFQSSKSENWRAGHSESDKSMAPPAYLAQNPTEQYLMTHLFSETPFASSSVPRNHSVPMRQLYEVTRVSLLWRLPMSNFTSCLSRDMKNYEDLWSSLGAIAKLHGKPLPERCSLTSWSKAAECFEGVTLSGDLKFSKTKDNPLFEFCLRPLKVEPSYRFSRKFGSDRFCTISIPGIDVEDLPSFLKRDSKAARDTILKWLIKTEHHLLGCSWRVFYIKPESSKKKSKRKTQSTFNEAKYRLYLFAEDGYNFRKAAQFGELEPRTPNHCPMTVKSLIDWFMPASENRDQPSLKFFDRLRLGLTSTKPTIVFEPSELIRSDDARADCPAERRLDLSRSEEKKLRNSPSGSRAPIMNDGCGRISKAAALAIADELNLSHPPCAFQGRIAGAKGVWMVDALGETLRQNSRGYWIEITDSQLKFEGHPEDKESTDPGRVTFDPGRVTFDPARVTFEVHLWAKTLVPASLNFQLIPILLDRGVRPEVLKTLLEEDLTAKVEELVEAMNNGITLRKWNQDNYPVDEERARNRGIEFVGGIPDSMSERVNWFVEHGFEPSDCSFLKDLLFKTIMKYCLQLEDKMKISIGKSTQALMIADPLAVLEANEVHIGFSNLFRDPRSGWAETMIHDEDVLVARMPALLPSDIQKVRAVFKPELRMYRDVVVFSSKGPSSLAEKLSGGDFDGDKAWVCWEPRLVTPFVNAMVPVPRSLATYGIEKDETRIGDILDDPVYTSRFLTHAFNFSLQNNILGSCSTYHEAFCYFNDNCIGSPSAIAIAVLLSHLMDRVKGGFIFNEEKWTAFLKRNRLPLRLSKPAYRSKDNAQPTKHVIDQLVFDVAKGVRHKVLGKFSEKFSEATKWDDALARIWKKEDAETRGDEALKRVLAHMKAGLKSIVEFWRLNVRVDDDDDEGRPLRKPSAMTFKAILEKCRGDFLDLKPLEEERQHPVIERWYHEWNSVHEGGYWSLIKASALFFEHHKKNLVWWIAGTELGEMKATAGGRGTYRPVIGEIFNAFKLDGKAVDRAGRAAGNEGGAGEEDDDDDELGDLDWGSQWG